jgi:predicted transcriptional regulator
MLNLEQVRHLLKGRNLREVSRESDVYYNTLYRVATGQTVPTYSVLKRISDYLTGDCQTSDCQRGDA